MRVFRCLVLRICRVASGVGTLHVRIQNMYLIIIPLYFGCSLISAGSCPILSRVPPTHILEMFGLHMQSSLGLTRGGLATCTVAAIPRSYPTSRLAPCTVGPSCRSSK